MKAILFDVDDTIYDQAVRYQERYVYYGTQITVPDQMRGILEYCAEHMKQILWERQEQDGKRSGWSGENVRRRQIFLNIH